jgi:hypothetical protein
VEVYTVCPNRSHHMSRLYASLHCGLVLVQLWLFACAHTSRCFGDKGDVEDITEGTLPDCRTGSQHDIGPPDHALTTPPADIISTVEFDQTGNYLATGDKGGRVVLFERNETVSTCHPLSSVRLLMLSRKKHASTSSTPSSNRTSPSSIT